MSLATVKAKDFAQRGLDILQPDLTETPNTETLLFAAIFQLAEALEGIERRLDRA